MCGYRSLFEYIVHADVRRQNTPSRRDEKISLLFLSLSLLSSFTNAGHDRVQGYILQSPRGACHMAKVSATAARYHRSIAWSRQRNRNQALYAHVTHAQKKKSTKQPDVAHPSGNEEEEKVVVVVVVVVVPNWSLLTIHLHLLILILSFPHINIKHQQHRSSLQRFVKSWSLQVALRNPSPWESGQRRNKAFPICSSGSNESKLPMNMENLERNGNDHFLFEIPFRCWPS